MTDQQLRASIQEGIGKTLRDREGFAPVDLYDDRDAFDVIMNIFEEIEKADARK